MNTFSDPTTICAQLGLSEGLRVADFGSGSGGYTLAASDAVGDTGRVYAIDIQKDLLKKVKDLSQSAPHRNIEVVWGDLERAGGSKLGDSSVDVVIVANILFQTENKDAFLNEVYRVLKPKGRVLLVDWLDSFRGLGPQPGMVVTEEKARTLFEKHGFVFDREITKAGSHHYGGVFRK